MTKIEFIKCRFEIAIKRLIEYKASAYSAFFANVGYSIAYIIVALAISNLSLIPGWTEQDYMFVAVFNMLVITIAGLFVWRESLFSYINDGRLNLYLYRPISPFFNYLFNMSDAIVNIVTTGILVVFFAIYYHLSLMVLIPAVLISILIAIFIIFVRELFNSVYFFNSGITTNLHILYWNAQDISRTYPPKLFENLKFHFMFFIFMTGFVSYLVLPIINHQITNYFFIVLGILIVLIALTYTATKILWHYGLKKYEGYN